MTNNIDLKINLFETEMSVCSGTTTKKLKKSVEK